MKILNLYSGIGGNRKLWGNDHKITAVEYNEEIAAIYKDYFPNDTLIIGDAHEYLLKHYKEFDFIWSSRPCQTHSRARFWASKGGTMDVKYPDMTLYEEIIFLQHYYDGDWIVENVFPFYKPLIEPTIKIGRHLFWASFKIQNYKPGFKENDIKYLTQEGENFGFNISQYKIKHRKDQVLRNCVNPDLGLYILEQAQGVMRRNKNNQQELFQVEPQPLQEDKPENK